MTQIIGIVGASGSGKSTITHHVANLIAKSGRSVSVVNQDAFYLPCANASTNFDEPSSVDLVLLKNSLDALKTGNSVNIPIYDFRSHSRRAQTDLITPSEYILVEGLFLMSDKQLRCVFDAIIYLDVPNGLCLKRRIARDKETRGRDLKEIKLQYETQVLPGFYKFILPLKSEAAFIVKNDTVDLMANTILRHLNIA